MKKTILILTSDPFSINYEIIKKSQNFLKKKLLNNKIKKPLFDTKRYTANFENGLKQAYKFYCNGNKPEDIKVEDRLSTDIN